MRSFLILLCMGLCVGSMAFSFSDAHARRAQTFLRWFMAPDVHEGYMTRPYSEDGVVPHSYLRHQGVWEPQDWVTARGSAENVIRDFYVSGIIVDQSSNNGVPVLEVGNLFLSLSSRTKAQILEFLDYAYGVTALDPRGVIHIEHEDSENKIGLYTADGLHLQ